jgi:hypothetical protein
VDQAEALAALAELPQPAQDGVARAPQQGEVVVRERSQVGEAPPQKG